MSWAAGSFEVTSHSPVDAGMDGEAVVLDPPLRFSIRPTPLHVRLPKQAIGYSPAARTLDPATAVRGVWRVTLGRPAQPLPVGPGDRDASLAEFRYTMPITPSDGWLREE
jgi:hypothetical protein